MALLQFRSASEGYWVGFLLPLAMYLSRYQSEQYFTNRTYHFGERNETLNLFRSPSGKMMEPTTIILCILIINTVILTIFRENFPTVRPKSVLNGLRIFNGLTSTAILTLTYLSKGNTYENFVHLAVNFVFPYVFYHLIAFNPKSFTFGEGILVTQGLCTIFWASVINVPSPPVQINTLQEHELITLLCQVGFLSIILISRLLVITKKPWTFMFMEEFLSLWAKCCLIAVACRVDLTDTMFFLQWIFGFFFTTQIRMTMFAYWTTLFVIGLSFVAWANWNNYQASTMDRKYFHFLVVAVYLPGYLMDYNLLYEATVALAYIFFVVELIRYMDFEFNGISKSIDSYIGLFRDKQDEGALLLTPLYLLIGCSIPLWLHGLQLHYSTSDWNTLGILSGVLSVGIGDTFASVIGSKYGRIRFKDNGKSVEGTVCCILSQLAVITLLHTTGLCTMSSTVFSCAMLAILLNSFVEAMTDQIDNFVLPLVTYITIYGLKVILYYNNFIELS